MECLSFMTGGLCIIAALLLMFRLIHYAPFYGPSYFFWIGVIFIAIGVISCIKPLVFLFILNRIIATIVLCIGFLLSVISLLWPAKVYHSKKGLEIDRILPEYIINEYHEVSIDAPIDVIKKAIQSTDISDVPIIHLLTKIRGIEKEKDKNMGDVATKNESDSNTFSTSDFNFYVVNPKELITVMILSSSMITNSSNRLSAPLQITKLEDFITFNKGGYVKVAVNFLFKESDNGQILLSTETRNWPITKKDAFIFAIYWRIIYPGSAIIRRVWLDTIKKRALNMSLI